MMKLKAIFIDVDNTLLSFDEYVKQTMEQGFAHFGLRAYEPWMYDKFTQVNNGLWRQIEDATLTFAELTKIRWNRVFEALDIEFDGPVFEKYFRGALYDSAIPEEGAYELLAALKDDYLLYAASNGPYEQQLHRLEIAGMRDAFDDVFISEKVGASKPSEKFFNYAFAKINAGREQQITPQGCMMIGDSLTSDIRGGQMYGMQTCLYRRSEDMVIPEGVLVADSLQEVVQRVRDADK